MSYLGWRWTEYITTIMGFLGVRSILNHNLTSNN